jgi:hypothetical protein
MPSGKRQAGFIPLEETGVVQGQLARQVRAERPASAQGVHETRDGSRRSPGLLPLLCGRLVRATAGQR